MIQLPQRIKVKHCVRMGIEVVAHAKARCGSLPNALYLDIAFAEILVRLSFQNPHACSEQARSRNRDDKLP